ncbi:MAG: hypothetical protein ACFFDH_17515 [Promethearchaeota archaeon]
MQNKNLHRFRIVYLIGLIILFLSIFLEWYSFQMFDLENTLLVSWRYYFFSGWQTPFSPDSALNEAMRPENMAIPFLMNILLVIAILVSGYVGLFKHIEEATNIKAYHKYAYMNGFLLLLTLYYIIICPVMYLIPSKLYFPLLSIRDFDGGFVYLYAIGPGYILQLLSFPLLFPYSVFYFKTISTFIQKERTPEKFVQKTIVDSQELLDLDKFIAEEELTQNLNYQVSKETNIITTFLEEKK